ncbi:MAG: hypothetical protein RIC56_06090 [Pseudomonadales bacterium]
MTDLAVGPRPRHFSNPGFFFWMTIVMAAIVFSGFGISYIAPMATGSLPALAPVVHVHGVVYFLWLILLVVQAALINRGDVVLHRSLGLFGIGVAASLIIFGTIISVLFAARALAASDPTIYGVTYISLVAVLGFGLLFWLAIRNIRDPAAHKRFILLATTVFIIGGLNRIYLALFGIGFESHLTYLPKYLTVDLLIAALVCYDWRTLGSVHRATLIGGAVNVVPQVLHVPIVESSSFVALTRWLGQLAYY